LLPIKPAAPVMKACMIDSPSRRFATRPNQFAATSTCTALRIDGRINQNTAPGSKDKTQSPYRPRKWTKGGDDYGLTHTPTE
jgi:hypothetical protein